MNLQPDMPDISQESGSLLLVRPRPLHLKTAYILIVDFLVGFLDLVSERNNVRGIPEAVQADIFEPFFTTKEIGLGIGLSVSRSIIESQREQWCVESSSGAGATVHFTLPFAP